MESLLFQLGAGKKFSQHLQSITDTEVRSIFGATIFERGQGYANDEFIRKVKIEGGKIKAKVLGTDKYKISLEQRGSAVYGDCSCPYDGRCKHLAAFLMFVRDETDPSVLKELDTDSPSLDRTQVFENYLNSLSIEELKTLVRRFAPANFEQQIALQLSSSDKKDSEFAKIKGLVSKLFGRDLHDIGYFEEKIEDISSRLRPIWAHLPQDVAKLYAQIIRNTNKAFEEGYLYDDYSNGCYEGQELGKNMAEFLQSIPQSDVEKALSTIMKALDDLGYSTFDNFHQELWTSAPPDRRVFTKDLFLKHDLMQSLSESQAKTVFEDMRSVLNDNETTKILELRSGNDYFLVELSKHLEDLGKIKEAIKVLEQRLNQNTEGSNFANTWYAYAQDRTGNVTKSDIYERRLDLERRINDSKNLYYWTKRYVEQLPTVRSLRCGLAYTPQYKTEFEQILEAKSAAAFAQYLEDEKRLTEVLTVFKKHKLDNVRFQYPFFKRHKKDFPTEAMLVFEQVLKTNLETTGNEYYRTVVEVLQNIQPIEDKPYFAVRVQEIRGIYNRRRNLIQYLNDAKL